MHLTEISVPLFWTRRSNSDLDILHRLIKKAHFIFEPAPGGVLSAFAMGFAEVEAINPQMVFVQISAFGGSGPYAEFTSNDLVIAAMGGPVELQGTMDKPPVRVSVPQVWRHTGVEAASGAMAAHHRRLRTGDAQFVDLSAQSVMTWTMLNAMDAYGIQGEDFKPPWASVSHR